MKKFFMLMFVVLLLVGCCACGKNSANPSAGSTVDRVFPANSNFSGITLDGMTAEKAKQTVEEVINAYTLTVVLDENDTITYTAEDLNMTVCEVDYTVLLESVINQEEVSPELFSFDLSDVALNLERKNKIRAEAQNAYLTYDEENQIFILNEEVVGTKFNEEAVLRAIEVAAKELLSGITLLGEEIFQQPEIVADSEEAQSALEIANAMLDVSLTYTYATTSKTETIDREQVASWLMVGEDGLLVEIVPAQLSAYVSEMEKAHSTSSGTTQFYTTGGGSITVNVASAGKTVDTDALYNDIAECITNGVSGEREAPYVSADTDTGANFGGNYVEINLSAQHLWVYSNGECVVSTDIVSGCVSNGCATPTGLYTIKSRETNRYLVGDGYKSWVNYWMPFNGGIGLHDADGWRSAYGGTIYHYNGSHGCINMPKSAAAATYSYVSVGTYVIVYGGETSVSGGTTATDEKENPCANGHSWNSGTVTSEATCTAEGSARYTCSECGESKTASISMVPHSYSNGVCSVCGKEDPDYEPPVDVTPDPNPGSGTEPTPDTEPDSSPDMTPDSGSGTVPDPVPDSGTDPTPSPTPDSGITPDPAPDSATDTVPDTMPDDGTGSAPDDATESADNV